MNNPDWFEHFLMLVARYPEYGIEADLPLMTITDCWGTYKFLLRVTNS